MSSASVLTFLPAGDCLTAVDYELHSTALTELSQSELLCDWRFTSKTIRLGAKPFEAHDQNFFFNSTLTVIILLQHPL
jgi:hypothetical protein